jgi:hypothetical protein
MRTAAPVGWWLQGKLAAGPKNFAGLYLHSIFCAKLPLFSNPVTNIKGCPGYLTEHLRRIAGSKYKCCTPMPTWQFNIV